MMQIQGLNKQLIEKERLADTIQFELDSLKIQVKSKEQQIEKLEQRAKDRGASQLKYRQVTLGAEQEEDSDEDDVARLEDDLQSSNPNFGLPDISQAIKT